MSALNSMKQTLRPLGFYNLNDNTLINAELSAYAMVLDEISSYLSEIERERFISTAESYGLSMRELIFTTEQNEKIIQERRKILLYRTAITPNDFNKSSIKKAMEIGGITGYIIENPSQSTIYINCLELADSSSDKETIKSMVEEFLPAHLECIFDFSNLNWDTIDSKNKTFDELDVEDLTWDEIDNYEEI